MTTASSEIFGLATVEALASGLPIVAAACPALEDMDLDNAYWTSDDPGDVKESVEKAARLRTDRSKYPAELGRFDIRRTTEQRDEFYEELWEKSRHPS